MWFHEAFVVSPHLRNFSLPVGFRVSLVYRPSSSAFKYYSRASKKSLVTVVFYISQRHLIHHCGTSQQNKKCRKSKSCTYETIEQDLCAVIPRTITVSRLTLYVNPWQSDAFLTRIYPFCCAYSAEKELKFSATIGPSRISRTSDI